MESMQSTESIYWEPRGPQPSSLLVWSMWAVAYCIVNGVKIISPQRGERGRMGWWLDNAEGKAKRHLDEWRAGAALVNGRALIDAHQRLMDEVKR